MPHGLPTSAAVDALLRRSFPPLVQRDYLPSVVVLALPIMARANSALLRCGTYHVAEAEDGSIIGAGGWTKLGPQGAHRAGTGHVRHFVTDLRHTRRGIGSGIMARVADQAAAAGLRALDCVSTPDGRPVLHRDGLPDRGRGGREPPARHRLPRRGGMMRRL